MKRIIIMALGVLLALALATPMAPAQVGQGANASGTAKVSTLSDKLAAAWAQWAYSKPVDVDSPLIGGDPNYSEDDATGHPWTGHP